MTASWQRRWYEGYCREVEKNIARANEFNQNQTWVSRQMTKEEYDAVFGEKPISCHKLKIAVQKK